jgi:hypothetical protein
VLYSLNGISTITRVLACTTPFSFHLSLLCDTEELETAKCVVAPLLSSTAVLAECSLRLCREPDPSIRALAIKTIGHATGNQFNDPDLPFQFLSLPKELRCQILEHTDLITPLSEIQWDPEQGFRVHYKHACCSQIESLPSVNCSCQMLRCRDNKLIGVFCPHTHAATSSKCRCWVPPTPLFLVYRRLHEEARRVFLSGNRLIITPSGCFTDPVARTPDRLEASVFFAKAVRSYELRFLRFIEIVFRHSKKPTSNVLSQHIKIESKRSSA